MPAIRVSPKLASLWNTRTPAKESIPAMAKWEQVLVLFLLLFLTAVLSLQDPPAPEGSESLQGAVPRGYAAGDGPEEGPLVMVGILARNTAHTLPNFLGYFENLDYPKHRISVW